MNELISDKEAKLAWAEGVAVQVATGPDRFRTLVSSDDLGIFDRGNYFRLKPRTITINGIEVPAPFEPKEDDGFWHISTENDGGYAWQHFEDKKIDYSYIQFGAWRNEEEIKQVVSALRSVFKGGV